MSIQKSKILICKGMLFLEKNEIKVPSQFHCSLTKLNSTQYLLFREEKVSTSWLEINEVKTESYFHSHCCVKVQEHAYTKTASTGAIECSVFKRVTHAVRPVLNVLCMSGGCFPSLEYFQSSSNISLCPGSTLAYMSTNSIILFPGIPLFLQGPFKIIISVLWTWLPLFCLADNQC